MVDLPPSGLFDQVSIAEEWWLSRANEAEGERKTHMLDVVRARPEGVVALIWLKVRQKNVGVR